MDILGDDQTAHDLQSDLRSFLFLAHLSTACSRGAFRGSPLRRQQFLLPNRWASLDQTWQECSLGGPL